MSVPTINPLAAALQARLALDPEVILAGLDPVPLPSDRPRTETARPDQPQKPAIPTTAVETARAADAIRQSGVAPLMADLEQAIGNRALPAPVREAAAKVVALQTPVEAPVTAETIKRAVAQSGLFLEPLLARQQAPAPDLKAALLVLRQVLRAAAPPAPVTEPAAAPTPEGAPPRGSATPPAASPQGQSTVPPQPAGLAQTYAPPQGVRLPDVETPELRGATAQAAPAPNPSGSAATSFTPRQAISPSTTLLPPSPPTAAPAQASSTPAAVVPTASPTTPSPMTASAPSQAAPPSPQAFSPQTGPGTVSQAAATALPATALAEQPLGAGQRLAASGPPQTAALPLPGLPQEAEAAPEARPTAQARAERPTAVHEETPAPPVKGAPPQGQRAAQPQLAADADPASVIRHLERATSGAIARTELFQLASLPDAPRADGELAARQSSWLFEVPLATLQGPAVAQFEIEKDGSNGEAGREAQAWRTRFSVDMEPLGLIHALLVLSGGKTSVTLWAERKETLARLRRDQAELAGSLEAEVAVYPGQPRAPAASPGRFLDASS